jgi:lysophospholipase L1-like esterase
MLATLRPSARGLTVLLFGSAALACSDSSLQSTLAPSAPNYASEGRGDFQRYVAIGTSVSMGYQADGVLASFQETSWPAQLARMAQRDMSLPLIASPGCGAPIAAPLALNVRISGEPITTPFTSRICAPNEPGVVLPSQNVAINGATTLEALTATPEAPDPTNDRLYARVLAPGQTQVSAMLAQNPKIVSVELGGNEVLGARLGYIDTGANGNVVSVATWAPQYREVVGAVASTAKRAVLVGLLDDIASFPSMRRAQEFWDARATFAPLYVAVSPDCADAANKDNLIFAPTRIAAAAQAGAFNFANQLPPYVLSCANAPDFLPVEDYVLAPASVAAVNAQLAAMNAVIRQEAADHGYAYFSLGALYEDAVVKPSLDAVAVMTTAAPFGSLISIDGVHPNAAGATVLAQAAAAALNGTYRMGIPLSTSFALAR